MHARDSAHGDARRRTVGGDRPPALDRGPREGARQVSCRPDRLSGVLERRDGDGVCVPQGMARGARRLRTGTSSCCPGNPTFVTTGCSSDWRRSMPRRCGSSFSTPGRWSCRSGWQRRTPSSNRMGVPHERSRPWRSPTSRNSRSRTTTPAPPTTTQSSRRSTFRSAPDGLIVHTAGFDLDGGVFRIFDVWESRQQGQRFIDEKLNPVLEPMMAGAAEGDFEPPSHESWYELHDTMS